MESASRFCGVCGFRLDSPEQAPGAVVGIGAAIGSQTIPSGAISAARVAARVRASQETPTPSPPSAIFEQPESGATPPLFGDDVDLYVGKTLNNRFHVEVKLGEGGFGAVYRGVQKGTNRVVALKLLHPEMTQDKNVVERFRREGQVLCRLKDAHTVTTYDFDCTEDGTLFIAMELLEGRSLHDVFSCEAPIAWPRMVKIISEMCSSLGEAHAMGIVHRDLKPENVHLEKRSGNSEFVKVLDFGIAKMLRGDGIGGNSIPQLTATGQTLGTLEYMSPEQLMGHPLDGRSDIYGLGVLAFELLTGRLPFPDAIGPAMQIAAQLKKVPEAPSVANPDGAIPAEVDALILKMLAKDRKNRFADVSELRDECIQIVGGATGTLDISSVVTPIPQAPSDSSRSMPEASRQPGPATQAIINATAPSRAWLWILAVLVVGGGALAFFLIQR